MTVAGYRAKQHRSGSQDRDEFARLSEPYRHELLVYCYRMLGSVHDAEDLVQEVYLRAWRSYERFEGRASLRTWLYRIATNACFNALQHSSRRMLPSGLGQPSEYESGLAETLKVSPGPDMEIPWLEPFPDRLMGTMPEDPAAVVAFRADIRLAVIAALQLLPAKQRAVLLLREALTMSTAQIADQLGMSAASVNSLLQRARARLDALAPASDEIAEPEDPDRRALLDRYTEAFEAADVEALTRLFTKDAIVEMPPVRAWFTGPDALKAFFTFRFTMRTGRIRLVRTSANGQPAFAAYRELDDKTYGEETYEAVHVHVLTVVGDRISHAIAFSDNANLIQSFGLPLTATAEELDHLAAMR